MKLGSRRLLFIVGAFLFAIGLLLIGVRFIGCWLQYSDKPEKSDAIIVLAGNPTRAIYAAEPYLKGSAPKIYISRPVRRHREKLLDELGVYFPYAEEVYRQVLLKKGVPDSDIRIFGKSSISTVEEAAAIKELFKGSRKRLLVVTSPYHIRRAKMIFGNVLKDHEIRVVGTPYEPFPQKWWTNQDLARNVILEVVKILFYKLGGRFYSKEEIAVKQFTYTQIQR
jgi:uncharacterized SAM-binding protein YcdF (DUF218 family)